MNLPQITHTRIISFVSYVVLSLLIIVTLKYDLKASYYSWFAVAIGILLVRDIIILLPTFKLVEHTHFLVSDLYRDMRKKKISILTFLAVLNRAIIFPTLLVLYCLYLLIEHTNILALGDILALTGSYEYIPIALVIGSWIGMVLREESDTPYFEKKTNPLRTRLFLIFSAVLAVTSIALIWRQTASLGLLSFPISIIAGLLIVLIGSLLLEEK